MRKESESEREKRERESERETDDRIEPTLRERAESTRCLCACAMMACVKELVVGASKLRSARPT